ILQARSHPPGGAGIAGLLVARGVDGAAVRRARRRVLARGDALPDARGRAALSDRRGDRLHAGHAGTAAAADQPAADRARGGGAGATVPPSSAGGGPSSRTVPPSSAGGGSSSATGAAGPASAADDGAVEMTGAPPRPTAGGRPRRALGGALAAAAVLGGTL